ncbi:MAG: hypothetical protein M0Z31_06185 [Clostridia bacterium]|nr:hypothetical protein [Clostridia bacterium]
MGNAYGDQVKVEYVEITKDSITPYPQIEELLQKRGVLLPVVAVDGVPIWVGGISLINIMAELSQRGIRPVKQ